MPEIITNARQLRLPDRPKRTYSGPEPTLDSGNQTQHRQPMIVQGWKVTGRWLRRPFGLRWGRYLLFARMLRADGLRASDLRAILRVLGGAALELARGRRRPPKDILADYRVCVRCCCHEWAFHRCSICFCSMPLKLAAGGGCGAREIDPASPLGFSVEKNSDGGTTAKPPPATTHAPSSE